MQRLDSFFCFALQYIAILVAIEQPLNPYEQIDFDVMTHTVHVPFLSIGLHVSMPHEVKCITPKCSGLSINQASNERRDCK